MICRSVRLIIVVAEYSLSSIRTPDAMVVSYSKTPGYGE